MSAAQKIQYDELLEIIADYVCTFSDPSTEALETARLCLADALGCALLALQFPACRKLLGPFMPGTLFSHGCRIPGTGEILDPIAGAFNLGCMIRWLDFNDTWLAAEWGHPSDNLGGILPLLDYLSRQNQNASSRVFTVRDLLLALIKAYEIQGILALSNSFNRLGFDHVILVKIATTALATHLLGGSHTQVMDALSNGWIDTGPLRTYRHSPNTGSRKSWAAGDATSRGVMLALLTLKGEMGYSTALTAPKWGFQDVIGKGTPLTLSRPLEDYVMRNILFKISFPAEFHAQTAVEAALKLHSELQGRLSQIRFIDIQTHESAMRIIDKRGPLSNPADRDHCLQYMVAVALLKGKLSAEDYEDEAACDERIDWLRERMRVRENRSYSTDYLDADKRSMANSLTITFEDGSHLPTVTVEYPLGHRRRRREGEPWLFAKFESNLSSLLPKERVQLLLRLFHEQQHLEQMPISNLTDLFCP